MCLVVGGGGDGGDGASHVNSDGGGDGGDGGEADDAVPITRILKRDYGTEVTITVGGGGAGGEGGQGAQKGGNLGNPHVYEGEDGDDGDDGDDGMVMLSVTSFVFDAPGAHTFTWPYLSQHDVDVSITPKHTQHTTQTHPTCLLYTSPSPRDRTRSRMPSSA